MGLFFGDEGARPAYSESAIFIYGHPKIMDSR
jgi:hypothetical protein